MTSAELIQVLQEEALRRTYNLVQTGRGTQEIAYEIGRAVQGGLQQLQNLGYLPVAMRMPRDIIVDYDRYLPQPPFSVTLRF